MLLDPFRPCEIEFMAESTMIDVMPSIHMGTLHFISVIKNEKTFKSIASVTMVPSNQ